MMEKGLERVSSTFPDLVLNDIARELPMDVVAMKSIRDINKVAVDQFCREIFKVVEKYDAERLNERSAPKTARDTVSAVRPTTKQITTRQHRLINYAEPAFNQEAESDEENYSEGFDMDQQSEYFAPSGVNTTLPGMQQSNNPICMNFQP